MSTHNIAKQYLDAGLSVVPATKNKTPALPGWTQYQKHRPLIDEVDEWFDAERPYGIGVVCGTISGGLEVLDLDAKHDPSGTLNARAEAAIKEFAPGLWERLPRETTPSAGLHLYFRSAKPAGNMKLAMPGVGTKAVAETRGEGGFIVSAPTPGYIMANGSLTEIPTITDDERDSILAAARSLDESEPKVVRAPSTMKGAELSPLDDYNLRGDALDLLRQHGWHVGAGGKLRRPGKDHGCSATWNHAGKGKLCVFSSSTPFDMAPSTYSPAGIYTVLQCGGDFSRAAAELRRLGYGDDRQTSTTAGSEHEQAESKSLGTSFVTTHFPEIEIEPEEGEVLIEVEPIVTDLLEPGDKMIVASGSKSFKTWTLIQLAYSIACGAYWLGFGTRKTNVLFLNFEIKPRNFWRRVFKVRRALGLSKTDTFRVWNLRGKGFSMDSHADELIARTLAAGAGVIVLDPIYKLFGNRNESSAGDMATLMTLFDRVATETGAAIIFAHHFAKGSTASKDAVDRASGSGVFARDPDCILTLTRLDENEGANTFAASVTLREFAPVADFAVRREHPIMVRADNVNVRNLHEPSKRTAKYSVEQVLDLLPADGVSNAEWQKLAKDRLGMSRSTFFETYAQPAKTLAKYASGLWFRSDKSDKSDLGKSDRSDWSESGIRTTGLRTSSVSTIPPDRRTAA